MFYQSKTGNPNFFLYVVVKTAINTSIDYYSFQIKLKWNYFVGTQS